MTDPVIKDAINLRDRLRDCAKEFRIHRQLLRHSSGKEMAEHDAKTCDDAAAMLQTLGTEITRLRLTIQHFAAGTMSRTDLRNVVRTWNSSPADADAS